MSSLFSDIFYVNAVTQIISSKHYQAGLLHSFMLSRSHTISHCIYSVFIPINSNHNITQSQRVILLQVTSMLVFLAHALSLESFSIPFQKRYPTLLQTSPNCTYCEPAEARDPLLFSSHHCTPSVCTLWRAGTVFDLSLYPRCLAPHATSGPQMLVELNKLKLSMLKLCYFSWSTSDATSL